MVAGGPRVKIKIIDPNGRWPVHPGLASPDPGRDKDPARRRQARSLRAELQARRARIRNSIVSLWPWDLGCLTYWVKSLRAWEEPDDLAGRPRDIGDG